MMKQKFILWLLVFLLPFGLLRSQDFQYSWPTQFYLNPAFVGNGNLKCSKSGGYFSPGNLKLSNMTRSQWGGQFVGNLTCLELAGAKSNWAFGSFLQNELMRDIGFESQYLSLATSYRTEIKRNFELRFGYQLGLGRRNITKSNFNFADEFNGTGFDLSTTNEFPSTGQAKGYIDYGSIGMIALIGNYSIGFSGHHLTNPLVSMWGGSDRLNRRFSVHMMKTMYFRYSKSARDIAYLVTEFKQLGTSQQFNIGVFYEWKRSSIDRTQSRIIFGSTFRGLPVKSAPDGLTQSDAVIFHTALQRHTFKIGYSFDAPVSKSRVFGNSHEITLTFQLANVECQSKETPTEIGVCPLEKNMSGREIRKKTLNRGGRIKVWSIFDIIFN